MLFSLGTATRQNLKQLLVVEGLGKYIVDTLWYNIHGTSSISISLYHKKKKKHLFYLLRYLLIIQ